MNILVKRTLDALIAGYFATNVFAIEVESKVELRHDFSYKNAIVNIDQTSKYRTIAHDMIDIEKKSGLTKTKYVLLDSLIDEAKKSICIKEFYSKQDALKILRTINQIILKNGFTFDECKLLSNGLNTRKIDCDMTSTIYLGIGEALNLPISVVNVPGHEFVRWQDYNNVFNWETISAKEISDLNYVILYDVSLTSLKKGVFLKTLNDKEILSNVYFNLGSTCDVNGDFHDAIKYYNLSLKLNPNNQVAHFNLGNTLLKEEDTAQAFQEYKKSIDLDPNDAKAHFNKAVVLYLNGKLDDAIDGFNQSINLNPRDSDGYFARANVLLKQGYPCNAIKDYITGIGIFVYSLTFRR
ncbi:MAG: tetratricopeptide repeat protein [Candidatus Woesearchaeota archaeon]|jgi:tetratricopeptide (TPR) repeat protein